MLVKYDVTFYKGDQIPIFMFKMDHENDFVEQFVISLFQINQCKQIKTPNDISEYCRLEGTFYDCCPHSNDIRVILSAKYRNVTITGKQIKLEFRIDEADLYMNDYKGYEFRMQANEHFKVNLVFCSTKSKVDKEYYVGYAHVTEVIK